MLGAILFDDSQNWMAVYAGRWLDPRAYVENVTSGSSDRVLSTFAERLVKRGPELFVENQVRQFQLIAALARIAGDPESARAQARQRIDGLAEAIRTESLSTLLCWLHNKLGDKFRDFERKSQEEKERILAELVGNGTFDLATGMAILRATQAGRVVDDIAGAAEEKAQRDLANLLKLRERQLALGTDPARGFIQAEGTAGARLEQALGRTISRSTDAAADFVDSQLGAISLKGPIPAQGSVEGLANAVIRDAMGGNAATRRVVVDTFGLSQSQISALKATVGAGT